MTDPNMQEPTNALKKQESPSKLSCIGQIIVVCVIFGCIGSFINSGNNSSSRNQQTTMQQSDTAVPVLPTDEPNQAPTADRAQDKAECNAWLQEATSLVADLQMGEIARANGRHAKMLGTCSAATQAYIVLGMAIKNYEENDIDKAEKNLRIALSLMDDIARNNQ